MAIRWLGHSLVAAALFAGVLPATAADAPPVPEFPRAACKTGFTDPEGDAAIDYTSTGMTGAVTGSNDYLDVKGVTIRLTADKLLVFLSTKALAINGAGMDPYDTAYRYIVSFKAGTKVLTFGIEQKNPTAPVAGLDSTQYPTALVGSTAITGFTATFYGADATHGAYAVWTAPRDKTESLVGYPLVEGETFTAIAAKTMLAAVNRTPQADELTVPATTAWPVTDESCFGAPPASLALTVPATVQYGDGAAVKVTLTDEGGTPLAGKKVQLSVTGSGAAPVSATTNAAGVAAATVKATVPAGTATVVASYAGDETVGKATASAPLKVVVEKAVFGPLTVGKPSATSRVVTATLLDDDKSPAAGQKVDFYVNTKKVATVVTSSAGTAVYKGAKPGQSVQAKFAGTAGKYAAATSKAVTA